MRSYRHDQDEFPFWRLVVAVVIGILLADLIRLAVVATAAGFAVSSVTRAASETIRRPVAATPSPTRQVPSQVHAAPAPLPTQQIMRLPSKEQALRSGDEFACIDGTIAKRVKGGWSQRPGERCVGG